jgi:iron complex outermembrane receptor protein
MQRKIIAGLICLAYPIFSVAATNVAENDAVETGDVIVSATGIAHPDTETTYASEVYTDKMIKSSGATSLYDFLAQHTSVTVASSFGNKVTPMIDMRGYGTGSGYQNIVISVDGQRLNNIDLIPQFIASVPLATIDRIEITKGSGSVMFGDGATAGSIQIYTKAKTGVTVSGSVGNRGALSGAILAGISEQHFDLSASAVHESDAGSAQADTTGNRDATRNNTAQVKLTVKPIDEWHVNLEAANSDVDTRYANPITLAQLNADPSASAGTYNHQLFESRSWLIGTDYDLTSNIKINLTHHQENKVSDFLNFANSRADYDYTSNQASVQYQNSQLAATVGVQSFDGTRIGVSNNTSKDNVGIFAQGEYRFDKLTLSAGARRERVEYKYEPNAGTSLNDTRDLNAWDIGLNYRFNDQFSVFTNYDQAFQAPDIDRFFTFAGAFNGFISPQKSRTINVGLNHVMADNRFKLTLFRAQLHNEIYFDPVSFINTNIDKSHKYGLEAQDQWQISDKLSSSLVYTYTRAIMDRATQGGGAFDGKDLPGVPKHGVTANLNFTPWTNTNLNLSQSWRSSTFAINDFANNFTQRQNSYLSTDIALSYQYRNMQWFAGVNNLFEHKNALFVSDDTIYATDYSRQFHVGMKADF